MTYKMEKASPFIGVVHVQITGDHNDGDYTTKFSSFTKEEWDAPFWNKWLEDGDKPAPVTVAEVVEILSRTQDHHQYTEIFGDDSTANMDQRYEFVRMNICEMELVPFGDSSSGIGCHTIVLDFVRLYDYNGVMYNIVFEKE